MIDVYFIRKLVRIGFFVSLAAALMLSLYSFEAKAWPAWLGGPSAQTATATGGGSRGGPGKSTGLDTSSVRTNDPLTTDYSAIVAAQNGEQRIFGREQEVEDLGDKLSTSDSHAVILQGDPKTGKTGVLEEYARLNPQDKIYLLNAQKLQRLSEVEAGQLFKEKLMELEKENRAAAGHHRVILYIENLSGLQSGFVSTPVDVLWSSVAAGIELFVIAEADSETVKEQFRSERAKNRSLLSRIEIVEVKPPSFDQVVSYLIRYRKQVEASGISVSILAIDEAARLATAHRPSNAFRFAAQLLQEAAQLVGDQQRGDQSAAERQKGEALRLQQKLEAINQDIGRETDESARAKLQSQQIELVKQIAVRAENGPDRPVIMSSAQKLAKIELQIIALTDARRAEGQKLNPLKSSTPESERLDRQIGELSARQLTLEQEIIDSENVNGAPAKRVGAKQVLEIASKRTGIPAARLQANLEEGIRKIKGIKKVVFGQDHVLTAIENRLIVRQTHLNEGAPLTQYEADEIKRGIKKDGFRPVASFWFAGSTGVGKTEVAKQVSHELGMEMIRFDMSEFMEKHYAARFLGAPPGYAGYGTPGELTQAVRENPYAVLLFDEIEKAHEDIYNVLLQVLDDGRLTDVKGTVDFRNVILVMTSNLAQKVGTWSPEEAIKFLNETGGWDAQTIQDRTNGETAKLRREAYKVYIQDPRLAREEGRKPMRPEFVNRLDEVILFNSLTDADAVRIAQKTTKQLVERLKLFYVINLRFTGEAISELMKYFNDREGGRSMRRAFDDLFRAPIARGVFDKRFKPGQTLVVSAQPDSGQLEFISTDASTLAAAEAQAKLKEEAEHPPKGAGKEAGTESPTAETEAMKARMYNASAVSADPKVRAARAATGALVAKVFDTHWLVSQKAFRLLQVRK